MRNEFETLVGQLLDEEVWHALPHSTQRQLVQICRTALSHSDALSELAPDPPHDGLRETEDARSHLLHQSQKMEAIARLASGVAHDFNNVLTVIHGYCYVLLAGLDSHDARRSHVISIREAGERATRLTKQLLVFSRKSLAAPRMVELNAAMEQIEDRLRALAGPSVGITLDLGHRPLLVQADPAQLEQVMINLVTNARDASVAGGELRVRIDQVSLDSHDCQTISLLDPGEYARIVVADSGSGIAQEHLSKIFEPFFSTKSDSPTNGLGLSLVYGIVAQSGGEVVVSSQVGSGTLVTILWPLRDPRHVDAGPSWAITERSS